MPIQTVLFDKNIWSFRKASKWLKDHDYKNYEDVDIKPNELRFRQMKPDKNRKYYTKKLDNGIDLVFMQ